METTSTNPTTTTTSTNPATANAGPVAPAARDEKAHIREFILSNFYVADPAALSDRASLLDSGVIDSTGVLEVIAFLERDYGLAVADDEISPENLDSIERIAAYVARKRGS